MGGGGRGSTAPTFDRPQPLCVCSSMTKEMANPTFCYNNIIYIPNLKVPGSAIRKCHGDITLAI